MSHALFPPDFSDDLFARWVAGRISLAERTWLDAFAQEHRAIAGLLALVAPDSSSLRDPWRDRYAVYMRISAAIDAPSTLSSHRSRTGYIRGSRLQSPAMPRIFIWAGACAAAAIGVLVISRYKTDPVPSSAPANEYVTAPGQRAAVTLSDGTRVMLNVASRLHIPADFGTSARAVTLDGEAQFIVTHDAKKPFEVHTQNARIRDLATTFVVRAYSGNQLSIVAVQDGRVAVQSEAMSEHTAVRVDARQVATLRNGQVASVESMTDLQPYFGWIDGTLVLRDVPVEQALIDLGRWYGMTFRMKSGTAHRTLLASRVNTVLPARFDPAQIEELAQAMGARVSVDDETVTFSVR